MNIGWWSELNILIYCKIFLPCDIFPVEDVYTYNQNDVFAQYFKKMAHQMNVPYIPKQLPDSNRQ